MNMHAYKTHTHTCVHDVISLAEMAAKPSETFFLFTTKFTLPFWFSLLFTLHFLCLCCCGCCCCRSSCCCSYLCYCCCCPGHGLSWRRCCCRCCGWRCWFLDWPLGWLATTTTTMQKPRLKRRRNCVVAAAAFSACPAQAKSSKSGFVRKLHCLRHQATRRAQQQDGGGGAREREREGFARLEIGGTM